MAVWLFALVVSFLSLPEVASAQADSTLSRVRGAGVDSLSGDRQVFFSPGQRQRAVSLEALLSDADAYLSDQLGVRAEFSVAVLGEGEWEKIWPFPYGLPYLSLEAPWVAVLPAFPERSVLFPDFVRLVGPARAADMVDNIGFHEVGHVYVSEFVYPEDVVGPPPLRWLDEFLATYVAYAVLVSEAPDRAEIWGDFSTAAGEGPRPELTSLTDFDVEYYGYLGSPDGTANYGWYQAVFTERAATIHSDLGLGFLRQMRAHIGAMQTSDWSTESVLEALEAVAPGSRAWAEGLSSPSGGA